MSANNISRSFLEEPTGLTFLQAREKVIRSINNCVNEHLQNSPQRPREKGFVLCGVAHIFIYYFTPWVLSLICLSWTASHSRNNFRELCLSIIICLCFGLFNLVIILRYRKSEREEVSREIQKILFEYCSVVCDNNNIKGNISDEILNKYKTLHSGHPHVSIVTTYRNKKWHRVPSLLLAEGDIITLMAGDLTPSRVIELKAKEVTNDVHIIGETGKWYLGETVEEGVKIHLREDRQKNSRPSSFGATTTTSFLSRYRGKRFGADDHSKDSNMNVRHDTQVASKGSSDLLSSIVSGDIRPPIFLTFSVFFITDVQPTETSSLTIEVKTNSESHLAQAAGKSQEPCPSTSAPSTDTNQSKVTDVSPKDTKTHAVSTGADKVQETERKDGGHHADKSNDFNPADFYYTVPSDSVELLVLSGDVRCFRLLQTPMQEFCKGILFGKFPDMGGVPAGWGCSSRKPFSLFPLYRRAIVTPHGQYGEESVIRMTFQVLDFSIAIYGCGKLVVTMPFVTLLRSLICSKYKYWMYYTINPTVYTISLSIAQTCMREGWIAMGVMLLLSFLCNSFRLLSDASSVDHWTEVR